MPLYALRNLPSAKGVALKVAPLVSSILAADIVCASSFSLDYVLVQILHQTCRLQLLSQLAVYVRAVNHIHSSVATGSIALMFCVSSQKQT